jgi:hypothetical protein
MDQDMEVEDMEDEPEATEEEGTIMADEEEAEEHMADVRVVAGCRQP